MAGFANKTFNISINGWFNDTEMGNSEMYSNNAFIVAAGFILLVSLLGIIGNSLVFWYLTFTIQRTKYTVYITNLAVADLIYLFFMSIIMCLTIVLFEGQLKITNPLNVLFGLEIVLGFGNYADMFFRTAISIEKCMSIVYPIWYHYKHPKVQSIVVCLLIWCLAFLVTLLDNLGCPPQLFDEMAPRCSAVQGFLSVLVLLICIPIMVISSLIILIRIWRSSRHTQSSRFTVAIVASVIVFLLSVAPMRLLWLLFYLHVLPSDSSAAVFFFTVYLFISLNSSLNPLIYFLIGRHRTEWGQGGLVKYLKNVFEDDEEKHAGKHSKHLEEGDTIESSVG